MSLRSWVSNFQQAEKGRGIGTLEGLDHLADSHSRSSFNILLAAVAWPAGRAGDRDQGACPN
jgi:hypothetical protein